MHQFLTVMESDRSAFKLKSNGSRENESAIIFDVPFYSNNETQLCRVVLIQTRELDIYDNQF